MMMLEKWCEQKGSSAGLVSRKTLAPGLMMARMRRRESFISHCFAKDMSASCNWILSSLPRARKLFSSITSLILF